MNPQTECTDRRVMNSRRRLLAAAAVGLILAACASKPRVQSDFDRTATFDHYHSYAWLSREHHTSANPLVLRYAHEAIDSELGRKGYTLVQDPVNADFVVDFTMGARDRIDVQTYSATYRGPWYWGHWYYGSELDVRRYREGVLAIDVFDGQTHQPVWTGSAKKELSRSERADSGSHSGRIESVSTWVSRSEVAG